MSTTDQYSTILPSRTRLVSTSLFVAGSEELSLVHTSPQDVATTKSPSATCITALAAPRSTGTYVGTGCLSVSGD